MITKYMTAKYRYTIQVVPVIRETLVSVYVDRWNSGKTSRVPKVSSYETYHDSWEAAHAYLLSRAQRELAAARDDVLSGEANLSYVQSMTPQGAAV